MRTLAILAGALLASSSAHAAIVINEVASKGDNVACAKEDWVELYNNGASAVDIQNYKMYDSKGSSDSDAKTFTMSITIAAGDFLLCCKDGSNNQDFTFGIGGGDKVTLEDASGNILDTTGDLPDVDFEQDPVWFTYAREKNGEGATDGTGFKVMRLPSPGATNKDMLPSKLQVFLNEIADKGTDMADSVACNPAADYIEIYNAESTEVDVTGWLIHDDNGKNHADAYIHAANHAQVKIPSKGFLLLCGEAKGDPNLDFHDFKLGIGSDDTITLLNDRNETMDSAGPFLKRGDATTVYARTEDGGGVWTYLTPPTPTKTNKGMIYKPEGDAPATAPPGTSTVVLNEVADKGSGKDVCDGEDWVELYNYGAAAVDIGGWHLADEKGVLHSDVYMFQKADNVIPGYSFKLLCKETHFQFGIGGTDTVSLLNDKKQLIDSIELTDQGSETKTMQRDFDGTGEWGYSENPPPSPGKSNCLGGCPLPKEDDDEISAGVIAGAVLGTFAAAAVVGLVTHRVINNYQKEKVPKQDKKFIDINNV